MRVVVYKPKAGRTRVELDDRRGFLRKRLVRPNVRTEDVKQVVGELLAQREEAVAPIREALRGQVG